jgi:hypothetical protein
MIGRPPGFGRENGGTAFVLPVLFDAPELPRGAADVPALLPVELVAPLAPRALPAEPRSPLLTCEAPPPDDPDDDPPPPRGTANEPPDDPLLEEPPLLPPLEAPPLLPPDEPPLLPPEEPPLLPPDEPPLEAWPPPELPPLPCECWADEAVGVPSRNIGTSTASAKPVHAGKIRFMA